jgi:hypothetical protein
MNGYNIPTPPYVAPLVIPPSILNELEYNPTPDAKRVNLYGSQNWSSGYDQPRNITLEPYTPGPWTFSQPPQRPSQQRQSRLPRHVSFRPTNEQYTFLPHVPPSIINNFTGVASMVDDSVYPIKVLNVRAINVC